MDDRERLRHLEAKHKKLKERVRQQRTIEQRRNGSIAYRIGLFIAGFELSIKESLNKKIILFNKKQDGTGSTQQSDNNPARINKGREE